MATGTMGVQEIFMNIQTSKISIRIAVNTRLIARRNHQTCVCSALEVQTNANKGQFMMPSWAKGVTSALMHEKGYVQMCVSIKKSIMPTTVA